MRPDLTAAHTTLLASGEYDLHWKAQVANGDGTLVDLSGRLKALRWTPPSSDSPIATLNLAFHREWMEDNTLSLSPQITTSTYNRLDDGTTYSPLLHVGRDVVLSVIPTARGAARPASGFYEVFRGKVGKTAWPGRFGDAAITCRDQSGRFETEWLETEEHYEAAQQIEDVMQAVLDAKYGAGVYTLNVPVATGKGLSHAYNTGKQSVWAVLWSLAQSIGWVVWWRYQADGTASLTLFEPSRSKSASDFTVAGLRDYQTLELDEEDIRNVCEVEYSDSDGARLSTEVEDTGSIADYGGIRRYFLLSEPPDSPIRSSADATTLGTAAVSDLRDPDVVATATQPLHFGLECAVDLLTYPADGVFFTATQALAPFSLTHSHEEGRDHQSSANLRGKPSGGRAMWRGRSVRHENPSGEYGLIDFREVAPGTAGNRRWAWTRRGRQVDEVWFAFKLYTAPWADDNWANVKTFVAPIPDAQDYIEIANADLPNASQVGALWVEPRIDRGGQLVVYNENVIERVKVDPVPADIDVKFTASIVSNAVDLSLTLTAAAGAKVYPATALVYEDGESGTLLATLTFSADGTKTKTDNAALGGRTLPAEGKREWVVVVTDVAGNVYRRLAEVNAPRLPYFDRIKQTLDVSYTGIDFFGRANDPAGLGGTLEVWVPTGGTTPADPAASPTASLVIAAADMPKSFGPASVAVLDAIASAPGTSLDVILKFTATDGRTTGQQFFPLQDSMQVLVDLVGDLRAGSIKRATQMLEQYQPFFIADTVGDLPANGDTYNRALVGTDPPAAYRWDGSAWVVDPSTPAVTYTGALIAGIVQAEAIGTGVLKAKLVGTERLDADNLNIGSLSLIASDAGAIVSGSFVAVDASSNIIAGLDLNATGTERILWAGGVAGSETLKVLADGTATFAGALSAATGTFAGSLSAATGTFAGNLSAAGGDFAGELSATLVTVQGGLNLAATHGASSALIRWGDGLAGSTGRFKPADASWSGGSPDATLDFFNLSGIWETKFTFNLSNGDLSIVGDFYADNGDFNSLVLASQTVSFGAADSAGTGYRVVRVPN